MSLPEPLIPVYSTGNAPIYRTDTAILCVAINQMAAAEPELFGGAELREALSRDIKNFVVENADAQPFMTPILPFLHDLLQRNGLQPFREKRLAFLGGEDFFDHSVFGPATEGLRGSFACFRDFHEYRNNNGLTADGAANVIVKGKYDIVLSGNVLNFPAVENVKSVFAACANVLKKGGIAIHGMDYSHDHYDLILSAQFHKACGQKQMDQTPPRFHPLREGVIVDYIALKQAREVMLSDAELDALERKKRIPPPTDYLFKQATDAFFDPDRRGFARDNFAPG